MKYNCLPVIFLLIFWNCSGSRYTISNNIKTNKEYKTFAEDKIKSGYNIGYNSDSSFAIYQKAINTEPGHPQNSISFFIYDLNKDKIIYEESVQDGNIEWQNDHLVKIVNRHGIVSQEMKTSNFQIRYYDVKKNIIAPFDRDIQNPDQN
jgi:uncharacterized ubiquitin-like protein YukD